MDPIETVPGELHEIRKELAQGRARMDVLEKGLNENNQATARVDKRTEDMVEFFESVRGAFQVLDMLGKLAKPLGYIVGAFAAGIAFWTALKTGNDITPK